MNDRPRPFTAGPYRLGDLELGPIGADLDEIAARTIELAPWSTTSQRRMRERLSLPLPATHRFALRRAGRPIGCLGIRDPYMRGPYIEMIAIFPEAQRSGCLARVVDWMAEEIRGDGANLWLCVTEGNTAARAAYAALGFVEIGPVADLARPGQTEIFMRKMLGPPV